ncbi:MAG: integration host factor subunit alpha [Spirochaetota bacterium]
MTLTKAQITENIQNRLQISKKESAKLVETVLKLIKNTLGSGEDVLISGFGKFRVRKKNERIGRNPATDKPLLLISRKVVTFKCSGKLRKKINGKNKAGAPVRLKKTSRP